MKINRRNSQIFVERQSRLSKGNSEKIDKDKGYIFLMAGGSIVVHTQHNCIEAPCFSQERTGHEFDEAAFRKSLLKAHGIDGSHHVVKSQSMAQKGHVMHHKYIITIDEQTLTDLAAQNNWVVIPSKFFANDRITKAKLPNGKKFPINEQFRNLLYVN